VNKEDFMATRDIQDNEREVFSIDGLTGYAISVGLLLVILFGLEYWALDVQQTEATNVYTIDNVVQVRMISDENAKHYKLIKE
jgi:hypothetical protein